MLARSTSPKPPYHVPLMAELGAVPRNGFRAMSTFSGAGGSCLGYRLAGYEIVWASEFVEAAAETYRANFPETPLDRRDIREVDPLQVLAELGLQVGELDVLEGSPPCASFSMAGARQKHWGQEKLYSGKRQRTDDLFEHYIRFVDAIRPKVFTAENVPGLTRGTARGHFNEILRAFRELFVGCGAAGEGLGFDDWLVASGNGALAKELLDLYAQAQAASDAFPPFYQASPQQFADLYLKIRPLANLLKTQLFGSGSPLNLKLPASAASDTD